MHEGESRLHHVPPAQDRQVVGVLVSRIRDKQLPADIGAADGSGKAAEVDRHQSGHERISLLDAQFFRHITKALVVKAAVDHDPVDSDAGLVYKGRAEGVRQVEDAGLKGSCIRGGKYQRLSHVDRNVLPAVGIAGGEVVSTGELGVDFYV